MRQFFYQCLFFFVVIPAIAQVQYKAIGVVIDEENHPISGAKVTVGQQSTYTDAAGFYQLTNITTNPFTIEISHENFLSIQEQISAYRPVMEQNFQLYSNATELQELVIDRKKVNKKVVIDPEVIRKIPGANAGVENILKTLPGVNSNNELSTQYAVRGGNYDENLVYVNEIEVYRPFLIRSGSQEGLSFTNTAMVQNLAFSAGGFKAIYGDKLSSVLDITYRSPQKFGGSVELSFLGGGLTVDWASKDQKWTMMHGLRYRNNQLLVKNKNTLSDYKPQFLDYQTWVSFKPNNHSSWSFLGNLSKNKYYFYPKRRQVNFGTIADPKAVIINYQGQEKDEYQSVFGALKYTYEPNNHNQYRWITSYYQAKEQEYYDLLSEYEMGTVSTDLGGNPGEVEYTEGLGMQLDHGRNYFATTIASTAFKGTHRLKSNQTMDWGLKYTNERVYDRLIEWQVVDSLGFHLAPPELSQSNHQPYEPYEGALIPYQSVRATNCETIHRLSAYTQYAIEHETDYGLFDISAGVRALAWQIRESKQIDWSPRMQVYFKPRKYPNMTFGLLGGLYVQPPSYKEYRNLQGEINENLKSQKAYQVVLSHDYSFVWRDTPFRLNTQVYYKYLTDVNPYTLENVRIRYQAKNNAVAYVYGADMRVNSEWLPGTESWFTFGYMRSEENIDNKGFIPRPTDQRLKFAFVFQDYMPVLPNLKFYLNLVYNTGLPGGAPTYSDPYKYVFKLPDYKRADVGFVYIFKDMNEHQDSEWFKNWKEFSVGFEIFNIFENANAITNTWVRDVYAKRMYATPNYMTMRTFNLKINARW